MKTTVLNQTDGYGQGLMERPDKNPFAAGVSLGHRRTQVEMQTEATGNQMSLGCPVQGSRRTGCNTGSTGSGSGSTAATAERTGGRNKSSERRFGIYTQQHLTSDYVTHINRIFPFLETLGFLEKGHEGIIKAFKNSD